MNSVKNKGYQVDTTLPILDDAFLGLHLDKVRTICECGTKFDIQHALSRKKSGFISLRHNHLRNITGTLLKEVCKNMRAEP